MLKAFKYILLSFLFIKWSIVSFITGYMVPTNTWIRHTSKNITLDMGIDEYTISGIDSHYDGIYPIISCWSEILYMFGFCLTNLIILTVIVKLYCCLYKHNNIYPDRWLLFIQGSIGIFGGVLMIDIACIYWYQICVKNVFNYEGLSLNDFKSDIYLIYILGFVFNNLYIIYVLCYYLYLRWREKNGILDEDFPSEYKRFHPHSELPEETGSCISTESNNP